MHYICSKETYFSSIVLVYHCFLCTSSVGFKAGLLHRVIARGSDVEHKQNGQQLTEQTHSVLESL